MSFLSQLDWRFATKQFDPTKKVSDEDLAKILNAIRMAPTSFGLQPFHVFVITDPATREAIKPVAYNQPQVTDASQLLVFCARNDMDSWIDAFVNVMASANTENAEGLEKARGMMKASLASRTPEQAMAWAAKQTYIAFGFGLAACAELGIDSCPMEGFDSAAVDKILGLPENMKSQSFLAIGYRKEGPSRPKVRFPESQLFTKK
ncbi:MAG: NAD(P)H-dependent oxidoreductase [Patescibacteria group bacterium]